MQLIGYAVAVAIALAIVVWLVWRRRAARRGPYPIVLVHGLFGFDQIEVLGTRHSYFRGVSEALEAAGETVHVVQLPPVASVRERAVALRAFVAKLAEPRVNLIAHSMGGIDARFAISELGIGERVASLVTVGTPHRGTPLAELGATAPARAVRAVLETVGIAASGTDWLTPDQMARFNDSIVDVDGVYYGCVVARPRAEQTSLPLKTSRLLLSRRSGTSDGVVPTASQAWGDVMFETEADHWAQIGWSASFDAGPLYLAIARRLHERGL